MLEDLILTDKGTYVIEITAEQLSFLRKAINRVEKSREYSRNYEARKKELSGQEKRGVGRPRKNVAELT